MELSIVEELMIDSLENPYLKIAGSHYFSGTQKTDVSLMTHELLYLNGIYKGIQEPIWDRIGGNGVRTGGFVEYFQKQKEWEMEAAFQKLKMCAKNMSFRGKLTLSLEEARQPMWILCDNHPGIKKNGNASYAIVDGGIHQNALRWSDYGDETSVLPATSQKKLWGAY